VGLFQSLENPPGEGTRPTGGEFCVGPVTSPGAFSFQWLEKSDSVFPVIGKIGTEVCRILTDASF